MADLILPTLFEYVLSDATAVDQTVTKTDAEKLFQFFKNCPLFKWGDTHNNCEARAEAVCVLLDEWHVPNYKGWVFSGAFLKNHVGGLKQLWNYHVATMLQVMEDGEMKHYIIDPATGSNLQTINDWAANVTDYPHSYHLVKTADNYIFPTGRIFKDNWHKRNKQNRKWLIQGLAGINGVSSTGKAQLCFRKNKVKLTAARFSGLRSENPLEVIQTQNPQ
ncbi:MAG: protein-glutamine glutaminase family protein [Lacibacter sp.]